jgi:tetratricopeptide (TPR) repeat protein
MHRVFIAALGAFLLTVPAPAVWAQSNPGTATFKPSDRAATLFYQAQVFAREGKFDRAMDAYMQALALEPQYTQARLSLAILYGKSKNYDKALKEIAIIQKQSPKDYLSYKVQGLLLQDSKDLKAAADAFEMYLKLAPAQQVKDAEELMERIETLRKGS